MEYIKVLKGGKFMIIIDILVALAPIIASIAFAFMIKNKKANSNK